MGGKTGPDEVVRKAMQRPKDFSLSRFRQVAGPKRVPQMNVDRLRVRQPNAHLDSPCVGPLNSLLCRSS